jgi:hypothetical protein
MVVLTDDSTCSSGARSLYRPFYIPEDELTSLKDTIDFAIAYMNIKDCGGKIMNRALSL